MNTKLQSLMTQSRKSPVLSESEHALVEREKAMIANELKQWLPLHELQILKLAKLQKLSCANLLAAIETEYELWIEGHTVTEIWRRAGEPTDHPCHPNKFSRACVDTLLEML